MPDERNLLPFGSVRNVGLFSNHWLANRLTDEPEWRELLDDGRDALDEIAELWKSQARRVERYGDEQGLEEGFIQPVLRSLGWKLKYQTFLQGRAPDYALFLDDSALDGALATDRLSPEFWSHAACVADAKHVTSRLTAPRQLAADVSIPPNRWSGISIAAAPRSAS